MKVLSLALAGYAVATALPPQVVFESGNLLIDEKDQSQVSYHHGHRPSHWPELIDRSDKTILELLNESLDADADARISSSSDEKSLPLRQLAKVLNFTNSEDLQNLFGDENAELTLLAPDDRALHQPHGHPHGRTEDNEDVVRAEERAMKWARKQSKKSIKRRFADRVRHWFGLSDDDKVVKELYKAFAKSGMLRSHGHYHPRTNPYAMPLVSECNPSDDEKACNAKRKFSAKYLQYHVLKGNLGPHELADRSTVLSHIHDHRVRIEPHAFPVPSLSFNAFSHTLGPIIKTKNGLVYLISAPLFVPFPPAMLTYMFPTVLSTFTSGIQGTGIDLNVLPDQDDDKVAPAVTAALEELRAEMHGDLKHLTVFAPTNRAFRKLGLRAVATLFSPINKELLKDLLSYHVVRDVVFFSDFVVNATAEKVYESETFHKNFEPPSRDLVEAGLARPHFPHHLFEGDSSSAEGLPAAHPSHHHHEVKKYELTTDFKQTTLPVEVHEFRVGPLGKGPLRRSIWLKSQFGKYHQHVKVAVPDVVTSAGGLHVIDSVLHPPCPEHAHLFEEVEETGHQSH